MDSLKEQIEECKRSLKVGTKVYRVYDNSIEEGIVVDSFPCTMDGKGDIREMACGTWVGYSASFRDGAIVLNQVVQHKWFHDINDARMELIRYAESEIKDHARDMERLKKIIADTESLINGGVGPDGRMPNPFSSRISQK